MDAGEHVGFDVESTFYISIEFLIIHLVSRLKAAMKYGNDLKMIRLWQRIYSS